MEALHSTLLAYAVGIRVTLMQLLRRLRGGFRPPELPKQPGRVAIVTGATSGIGLCTAWRLARLGMCVVVAGNEKRRGKEVVASIQAECGKQSARFLFLDLASLSSVRNFVNDFLDTGLPLHVLVNNAGVMLAPPGTRTAEGLDPHMGVNFLGHFLLTMLLLRSLREAGRPEQVSRVVCIGSATHRAASPGHALPAQLGPGPSPAPHAAYAGSKLALVLFCLRLQSLLHAHGDPITANMADPGVADTGLYARAGWGLKAARAALGGLLFKTPDEGSWTPAYAAAAAELEGIGGRYLQDEAEVEPALAAQDPWLQRRLWVESCRLVGVTDELGGGAME